MAGPNVMREYRGQPEATARALTDGGWIRSGDAGMTDEEGYVFVADRMKDMIISGGENIYPAEVETALRDHPAVADCGVIGVPDPRWGEVGRAVVVLAAGAPATESDLLGFLDGDRAVQDPRIGAVRRRPAPHQNREDPQEAAARELRLGVPRWSTLMRGPSRNRRSS